MGQGNHLSDLGEVNKTLAIPNNVLGQIIQKRREINHAINHANPSLKD